MLYPTTSQANCRNNFALTPCTVASCTYSVGSGPTEWGGTAPAAGQAVHASLRQAGNYE